VIPQLESSLLKSLKICIGRPNVTDRSVKIANEAYICIPHK